MQYPLHGRVDAAPGMDEDELVRVVRMVWAHALLWGGRILLGGVPAYALWCRLAWDGWAGSPRDSSGAPTAASFGWLVGLGFVWGSVLPWALLPFVSYALVRDTGDALVAPTILGRRRVPVEGAHETFWLIPGRGVDTGVRSVRRGHRWLLISGSGLWGDLPMGEVEVPMARAWVRGFLFLMAMVLSAFLGEALVMGIAGTS